ncbi:MAG: glycosyltransferase family 4 protein, partial [Acidimicrobiales bacterium]
QWPKLTVVRCGVDTTEFAFVDRRVGVQPLTVLSIGRLVQDKGYAVLLEAVAQARSAGCELRLVLGGEGPERPALGAMVGQLGLGGSVRFLGAVAQDRLVDLYRDADMFCLASFAEGLPIVLMEAMATGLPVVATSVAGIPELVRHGESGLLVPPGCAPALAAALIKLAADPELRRDLGTAARSVVEADFKLTRNVELLVSSFGDSWQPPVPAGGGL